MGEETVEKSIYVYLWITFYTGIILSVGFIILIGRICAGSKYAWLILLSVMLFFSNIFAILANAASRKWTADPDAKNPFLYL